MFINSQRVENLHFAGWMWGGFCAQEVERRRIELELRNEYGGKNDPERPPGKEPGDGFILLGLIIGVIVGGILGGAVGFYLDFLSDVLGLIGGIIIGGIVGTLMGDKMKKRLRQKRGYSEVLPGNNITRNNFTPEK